MNNESSFRCGYIALVGCPNVGKSTLMNSLIGKKISITSDKPQTTRLPIAGIVTLDSAQLIFLDTPGYQKKHLNALNKSLNENVIKQIADADAILFVLEQGRFGKMDIEVLKLLPKDMPVILVINKIDAVKSKAEVFTFSHLVAEKLQALPQEDCHYRSLNDFTALVPVSARSKTQLALLLDTVKPHLPIAPAVFDEDTLTTSSSRFLSEEIVREKIFRLMEKEVPYQCSVTIDEFKEEPYKKNKLLYRINVTIGVPRQQHKNMLIGEQGAIIKRISQSARIDMESLFDVKVMLETWVKVTGAA